MIKHTEGWRMLKATCLSRKQICWPHRTTKRPMNRMWWEDGPDLSQRLADASGTVSKRPPSSTACLPREASSFSSLHYCYCKSHLLGLWGKNMASCVKVTWPALLESSVWASHARLFSTSQVAGTRQLLCLANSRNETRWLYPRCAWRVQGLD